MGSLVDPFFVFTENHELPANQLHYCLLFCYL
jgi:hypothetical protein